MNRSTLILLISTLGLGSASAYLHTQLQEERERTSELTERIGELERQVSVPPQPTAQIAAPAAEEIAVESPPVPSPQRVQAQAVVSGPAMGAPDKAARERMREARTRMLQRERALMNDPEYREALRAQQRLSLAQMHPDLAAELGVSSEEARRLLDVLAEQQLRSMQDGRWFDPESRSDPNAMAEFQRRVEERQRADRAEMAQVLGDEGLRRWDDYMNTQSSRFRVRRLSSALEAAGIPLQQEQQRQLRQALADHERQLRVESPFATQKRDRQPTPEDQLRLLEEQLQWQEGAYERARNAVSGILSAEQLETYRQMHEQELAMQRAQIRLRRAQLESGELYGDSMSFSGTAVAMPAVVEGD